MMKDIESKIKIMSLALVVCLVWSSKSTAATNAKDSSAENSSYYLASFNGDQCYLFSETWKLKKVFPGNLCFFDSKKFISVMKRQTSSYDFDLKPKWTTPASIVEAAQYDSRLDQTILITDDGNGKQTLKILDSIGKIETTQSIEVLISPGSAPTQKEPKIDIVGIDLIHKAGSSVKPGDLVLLDTEQPSLLILDRISLKPRVSRKLGAVPETTRVVGPFVTKDNTVVLMGIDGSKPQFTIYEINIENFETKTIPVQGDHTSYRYGSIVKTPDSNYLVSSLDEGGKVFIVSPSGKILKSHRPPIVHHTFKDKEDSVRQVGIFSIKPISGESIQNYL